MTQIHTAESLRNSFHYFYPAELPAFKSLVRELPESYPVVVNIGSGAGTSGLAILEARFDSFLFTVDVQDTSSPLGCLEAERTVLKSAGLWQNTLWHPRIAELKCRNRQHHMTSKLFAERWPMYYDHIGQVDMVYVDGGHSYAECRDDILGWTPYIKPGLGIICVHDYNKQLLPLDLNGPHPIPLLGVNKAVDELLIAQPDKYELYKHTDSLISFRVLEATHDS